MEDGPVDVQYNTRVLSVAASHRSGVPSGLPVGLGILHPYCMFHLRDCFAFDFRIPRSQTAVFRKLREIPVPIMADLCSRRTPQDFSETEILEAFEWSKSLFSDPEAGLVADAGKAWMLHSIGKSDAARSIFKEIKKSDHYMHPFYQFQEDILRGWGLGAVIEFP